MKKKIFSLFLVVAALSGCIFSFVPLTACNIQRGTTVEDHIFDWAEAWNINIPKDILLLSYYKDSGRDYSFIYVLYYNGNDKEFLDQLKDLKNDEIVTVFKEQCAKHKEEFSKSYTLPEITDGYLWLDKSRSISSMSSEYLQLLYLPDALQILMRIHKQ